MKITVGDEEHEIDDEAAVARMVRLLLDEMAETLERQNVNWKVIFHGSGKHIKPVMEIYFTAI